METLDEIIAQTTKTAGSDDDIFKAFCQGTGSVEQVSYLTEII